LKLEVPFISWSISVSSLSRNELPPPMAAAAEIDRTRVNDGNFRCARVFGVGVGATGSCDTFTVTGANIVIGASVEFTAEEPSLGTTTSEATCWPSPEVSSTVTTEGFSLVGDERGVPVTDPGCDTIPCELGIGYGIEYGIKG
jgi:hypothetical protein